MSERKTPGYASWGASTVQVPGGVYFLAVNGHVFVCDTPLGINRVLEEQGSVFTLASRGFSCSCAVHAIRLRERRKLGKIKIESSYQKNSAIEIERLARMMVTSLKASIQL